MKFCILLFLIIPVGCINYYQINRDGSFIYDQCDSFEKRSSERLLTFLEIELNEENRKIDMWISSDIKNETIDFYINILKLNRQIDLYNTFKDVDTINKIDTITEIFRNAYNQTNSLEIKSVILVSKSIDPDLFRFVKNYFNTKKLDSYKMKSIGYQLGWSRSKMNSFLNCLREFDIDNFKYDIPIKRIVEPIKEFDPEWNITVADSSSKK